MSPYYDLNPGYRIYYVDGDHDRTTRMVVDHESWIMNLKEANLYGYPIWYKLYSVRSAYNMKALRPVDWDNLIDEMAHNQEMFDLYYKYVKTVYGERCQRTCNNYALIKWSSLADSTGRIQPFVPLVMLNVVNVSYAMPKVVAPMIVDTSVKLSSPRWMTILENPGNHGSIEASAIRMYPIR